MFYSGTCFDKSLIKRLDIELNVISKPVRSHLICQKFMFNLYYHFKNQALFATMALMSVSCLH
jgi:hypothetical protein